MKKYNAPQAQIVSFDNEYVATEASVTSVRHAVEGSCGLFEGWLLSSGCDERSAN